MLNHERTYLLPHGNARLIGIEFQPIILRRQDIAEFITGEAEQKLRMTLHIPLQI
jgi:hypothetical protein